jgi:outer membrane protein assembly factor BamB
VAALDSSGGEVWRTTLEDRSDAPPLVSGDFVVVEGCLAVHVLDARTGQLVRSSEEITDPVGVVADRVYGTQVTEREGGTPAAGSGEADVRGVALDDTGSERVISHAGGSEGPGLARTMVIAQGRLMGTQGDELMVYPGEGAAGARVQLPVVPQTRVLAVGVNRAVTAAPDGSVVGVDLAALRLAWRVVPEQVSRRFTLGLLASGRTVLVSAVGSAPAGSESATSPGATPAAPVAEAMAVSAEDGTVVWRRRGFVVGAATDTVAVLLSESSVVAVEVRTGRKLWARTAPSLDAGELSRAVSGHGSQPAVLVDGTVALTDLMAEGSSGTVGVDARTGRELWALAGSLEPVALEVAFGIRHGARPHTYGAGLDQGGDGEQLTLEALDPRTGARLWSAAVQASRGQDDHPWQLLSADPARSQTILLDLPATLKGGCG